ncbi:MAG TPA: hypothetical protein VH914_09090 [Acidimicrobiia bacterium]|nr:hypothetical protein [Acidimicrobiia bacterium]
MPDDEDASPTPDLGASGAAMREEWRAEQESITGDAAEQWRHSRTFLDLARDLMHRGDHVVLNAAGHRVEGVIVEVARDRLAFFDEAHDARVDVHIAESIAWSVTVVERARSGGRSGAQFASFRARLLELEGRTVTIATTLGPDRVTGTLGVGVDVVMVTTAVGETLVPLAAVVAVAPAD